MKFEQISNEEKLIFLQNLEEVKKNVATNFSFLKLDEDIKEELFQNALNAFLDKEQNLTTVKDIKRVEKYLTNEYITYLKELLSQSENRDVLNAYTNYFLENNHETAEDKLISYTDNIILLMPNISFEDCLFLTSNNENIKKLIKSIIYKNDLVNEVKLKSLLGTNLNFLLEPYCYNENITIAEDDSKIDNLGKYEYKTDYEDIESRMSFNYSRENFALEKEDKYKNNNDT